MESQEILLLVAREAGFEVTARQLARWHRVGLLPKPRQKSLGRGRGTQSVYPEGSAPQLIALCEFKRKERRLDYLRCQLWWAGFEVEASAIRKFIQTQWNTWDLEIENLVDRKSGTLNTRTLRLLRKTRDARFKTKTVRQARRRIGRGSFEEFARTLIELSTGVFQSTSGDEELLQRGINMMPVGHHKTAPLWLPHGIADDELRGLSTLMKNEFRQIKLERFDDEQLVAARNQCRRIRILFASLSELTERFNIRMGLSLVNPLFESPFYQCLMLRFYLALKNSTLGERFSKFEMMIGNWEQLIAQ